LAANYPGISTMESLMKIALPRKHPGTLSNRARRATALVAALGVALLLAACGTGNGHKNSLTLWYTPFEPGAAAEKQWKQFHVDPFTELYPDIDVKAVEVNGEVSDQKMRVALAAGGGPDIITADGPANAIPLNQAGFLADLGEASEKYGWQDKLLPWAYEMGFVDGKLVSLPTEYQTLLLYYNKDLFEANGWNPPTDRASLLTLAQAMQAKGVTPFAAGNADFHAATEWHLSAYFDSVAGPQNFHDALAGDIPWTDPSIVSAVQAMKDDFDAGYYGGGVKQYFSNGFAAIYQQFADGDAGMMVSGSWELERIPDGFNWDWVSLPMGEGLEPGMFPLSIGSSWSVNAKAADLDVATKYLDWFFSATDHMFEEGGTVLPVHFDPSEIPAETDPRVAATYAGIGAASEAGNVGYTTWTSLGAKAEAVVVEDMNKVLNGDLSVDDFCAELDAAYQEDKAAGLLPALFATGT
jgi:raffinose/stachyose/melibiose transport system substrate-binding protein